jgi:cell division septation protein DedD
VPGDGVYGNSGEEFSLDGDLRGGLVDEEVKDKEGGKELPGIRPNIKETAITSRGDDTDFLIDKKLRLSVKPNRPKTRIPLISVLFFILVVFALFVVNAALFFPKLLGSYLPVQVIDTLKNSIGASKKEFKLPSEALEVLKETPKKKELLPEIPVVQTSLPEPESKLESESNGLEVKGEPEELPPTKEEATTILPTITPTFTPSPTPTPLPSKIPTIKPTLVAPPKVANSGGGGWQVQVIAESVLSLATERARKLTEAGYPATVESVLVNGKKFYRVLIGPVPASRGKEIQKELIGKKLVRETPFLRKIKVK